MYLIITLLLLLPIAECNAGEISRCAGGTGYQRRDCYAVEKNDYTRYGVCFKTEGPTRVSVRLSPEDADALYEKLEREFNDQEEKARIILEKTRYGAREQIDLKNAMNPGEIIGFTVGVVGLFLVWAVYVKMYGGSFV